VLACLGVVLPANAATVLAKGLFSYEAPAGWFVHPQSNSNFPVASTNDAAILVEIQKSNAPIDDFIREYLSYLETKQKAHILRSESFVTAAGLDGYRLVLLGPSVAGADNTLMEKVFYIFDGGADQKILVEASCSPSQAARCEPQFDASMKTFSLE
jgi:hypothetical protein